MVCQLTQAVCTIILCDNACGYCDHGDCVHQETMVTVYHVTMVTVYQETMVTGYHVTMVTVYQETMVTGYHVTMVTVYTK